MKKLLQLNFGTLLIYCIFFTALLLPTKVSAAPIITAFSNITICSGTTTSFSTARINEIAPCTFQWQNSIDNISFTNIAGATAATFTTPILFITTYYRVILDCTNGSDTSNVLTVTISGSPTITALSNITICTGGTASLTSTQTGSAFICTTQWQNSTDNIIFTNIPGAISANYTTPALTQTTYYQNICTGGGCGGAAYIRVVVTVVPDPSLSILGPTNVCVGGTALLTTTTTGGAGTCTYQWQRSTNNIFYNNIAGATSATYTTPALGSTTYYRVVFTCNGAGCGGAVTSSPFTVTVVPDPTATIFAATTICSGGNVSLTSSTTGGIGICTYQWQVSTTGGAGPYVNIPGATAPNYNSPTIFFTTHYRLVFTCTGAGCVATSPSIRIFVVIDPSISASGSTTICAGGTALLSSSTFGGSSCTYQWQSSINNTIFTDIVGANSIDYLTSVSVITMFYRVLRICTASDCGTATSGSVLVVVTSAPTITASGSTSICSGGTATLTSSVSGGAGICTYEWESSTDNITFINIAGANSSNYTTPPLTATTYYRVGRLCSASGCGGMVYSPNIEIVIADPTITASGPTSVCVGNTTVLSSILSGGAGVCNLQWYNSQDNVTFTIIPGANAATYTTPPLSATTYYRIQTTCTGGICEGTYTSNTLTITVQSLVTGTVNDTICSNFLYTLPSGLVVLGPGVYSDTIPGYYCDSVITVTLVTLPGGTLSGLYAATSTNYHQVNPLTGAIINTHAAFANSLGWVNGAFTMHEQAAVLYWLSDDIKLNALNLTSGIQTSIPTAISTLPFFWGMRYYDGHLYTITTSGDNDKKLVRINPATGALDVSFPGIEINGSSSYDILYGSSSVINPITGIYYIPLYGNVILAFDIIGGTGSIITLSGYGTATNYIGLLEIDENTGEMYALSGFSDVVSITLTGPITASVALIKSLTTGSGFSNPISTFDSDNGLYIFQAADGCSGLNPLITVDVSSGQEWCSNPAAFVFSQMDYLNCTPSSILRAPENFSVFLYPNPVKDILQIEIYLLTNDAIQIQIFDISGAIQTERRMDGQIGKNNLSLELSNLSSGIYIVHIRSGRNQFSGKVIKFN